MTKKQTYVDFIIQGSWNTKNASWLKDTKKKARIIKKFKGKKLKSEIAKMCNMSIASFSSLVTELSKVAQAKMSLEEYANSGRQFAYANKVLATRKK